MNPITRAVRVFHRTVRMGRSHGVFASESSDPIETAAVLADALQDIDARLKRLEGPGAPSRVSSVEGQIVDEERRIQIAKELQERRLQPLICALWRPGQEERPACGKCAPCEIVAEREAAWKALSMTAEEAADDPDTARLADAIRVSLQCERDRFDVLKEAADYNSAELKRIRAAFSILSVHPAPSLGEAVEAAFRDLSFLRSEEIKFHKFSEELNSLRNFKKDVAYELGAERNPNLALDALKVRLKGLKRIRDAFSILLVTPIGPLEESVEYTFRELAELRLKHSRTAIDLGNFKRSVARMLGADPHLSCDALIALLDALKKNLEREGEKS